MVWMNHRPTLSQTVTRSQKLRKSLDTQSLNSVLDTLTLTLTLALTLTFTLTLTLP